MRVLEVPVLAMVAVFAAVLSAEAVAVEAPLQVRNLAPATQIFGVPRAIGADVLDAGYELSFDAEIANNFTSDVADGDAAFFDGETTLLTWGWRGAVGAPFGAHLELGLEIPYLFHDGGFLDAAIDGFHDAFGFDDNGRDLARRNQVDYFVRHDGEIFVDFQDSREGWGDVRASFGYQLARDSTRAWALRGLVELPTGETDELAGSEATDVALWVEHGRAGLFGDERASLSAAIGALWPGEGELVPDRQEDVAGWGHFGLGYRVAAAITLLGQLDYHTRLIDAGLDQVAESALQGTVGARFRYKERLTTDFAVIEDLTGNSTSDVTFQLRLAARLD